MELVKNIFFNTDKLTPNNKIKISYTGKFFQDNSTKVFIRYGFGENWENIVEAEMTKSELGFQLELVLEDNTTFNFCFKNEKDEWDNNGGENYIFTIEHPDTAIILSASDEFALIKPRRLRKSYIYSKKIRLAIYKMLIILPKLISGNYKKKKNILDDLNN
ncbi:MAG: hypothetical protein J6A36_05145 [Clostridia bacterium]|nr:hypothetical protein [Clostridia bacterium]